MNNTYFAINWFLNNLAMRLHDIPVDRLTGEKIAKLIENEIAHDLDDMGTHHEGEHCYSARRMKTAIQDPAVLVAVVEYVKRQHQTHNFV